jgi:phospholipid/cholesterol/gamma-HCH transport system substrate-binding protein
MQSAAKVGLLVVVFVGLLFGAYAALGRTLFAPKTDEYYAEFADAGGILPATTVQMSGVKIGSVTAVDLVGPRKAKVTFQIKDGMRLPIGSVATVATPLIGLGEVPLEIEPPPSSNGVLAPGSTLPGRKGGALDDILPDSKGTVQELTKTMAAVRKLLEDQGLKNRADKLLATSEKTIGEFGALAKTTNAMLAQNQASVARALQAASLAISDVRHVTYQVSTMLKDGKLQKDAKSIVAQLADVSKNANKLVTSMDKLVNDPKLRNPLANTMANVEDITEKGKGIAANTEKITAEGVEISKNVNQITKKAVPMMDTAQEVLTKATAIEDQLSGVMDKVGGFFTRKPGPGPLANIGLSMDLMREDKPSYWRTDLGFVMPISDGTLHAGIYDAFGSNKLTLQLGKQATPELRYRYGIYAAKPGVGVDYRIAPKVTLRGDVWDINRLRADLRAGYDFGNGIVGWIGVDRLFDRNTATIGIGLRR